MHTSGIYTIKSLGYIDEYLISYRLHDNQQVGLEKDI
jgi:hypothetical protein